MSRPLLDSLLTKLKAASDLDSDDLRAIASLPIRTRHLDPHEFIVKEGDRTHECCLIADGFAFRSKATWQGQTQILSLHVPGEIPDLHSLHLELMDHDLKALSRCTLGFIPHAAIKSLNANRPRVAAALWRETLVDASIFREWMFNIGSRVGVTRMAHLLAELNRRLEVIGMAKNGVFDLPITQVELGECLGLTGVHVNRVLKQLRAEGLVRTSRSVFELLDIDLMEERGEFDPDYLHLPAFALS